MPRRPSAFTIDRTHLLANGLVFAGLGAGASSSLLIDSSVFGNHGTLNAMDPPTDWVVDATLGRWALDFLATSSQTVSAANILAMSGLSTLSMSCWMKRGASNSYVIASRWDTAYPSFKRVQMSLWSDGSAYFSISNSTGSTNYGSVSSSGTAWKHLCLVYNGSMASNATKLLAYIDGVPKTLSFSGTIPTSLPTFSSDLFMGRSTDASPNYTTGRMSDLLVFNRVLSAAEVSLLADPSNVMLSGLVLPRKRRIFYVGGGATTHQASASIASDMSVSAAAVRVIGASAAVSADMSLSATAAMIRQAACVIDAAMALVAAATAVSPASAEIGCSEYVVAAGIRVVPVSADLSATMSLTATATGAVTHQAAATVDASMDVAAAAAIVEQATATIGGEMAVSAAGVVVGGVTVHQASVIITGRMLVTVTTVFPLPDSIVTPKRWLSIVGPRSRVSTVIPRRSTSRVEV